MVFILPKILPYGRKPLENLVDDQQTWTKLILKYISMMMFSIFDPSLFYACKKRGM